MFSISLQTSASIQPRTSSDKFFVFQFEPGPGLNPAPVLICPEVPHPGDRSKEDQGGDPEQAGAEATIPAADQRSRKGGPVAS